ncbi:hypothetical protein ACHQM5_027817 [Ranunculus cassubicifolius]
MSLSCLICQPSQKTQFEIEEGDQNVRNIPTLKSCCMRLDRNWSGHLSPPRYKKMRTEQSMGVNKTPKKGHRRGHSMSVVQLEDDCSPRLSRSGGMRRDWSFEDLRQARALGKSNLRGEGSRD